ncbi:Toprim domain-containing protein [Celeribacter marinus]|nr:Toprim domain-containing protein [Celeribacter marinus]
MLGPSASGAVRLSDNPSGPFVICEGIETGLSLVELLPEPASVWATLSTAGMKSLNLPKTPSRLILATDGDDPGRTAGRHLAQRAAANGWDIETLEAPEGTDWNDYLRNGDQS